MDNFATGRVLSSNSGIIGSGWDYRIMIPKQSVFIKAAAVIKSCVTDDQIDVAIKYVNNAGLKDYINGTEWDLLFYMACEKSKSLSAVVIGVDVVAEGAERTAVNGRIIEEDDYNG